MESPMVPFASFQDYHYPYIFLRSSVMFQPPIVIFSPQKVHELLDSQENTSESPKNGGLNLQQPKQNLFEDQMPVLKQQLQDQPFISAQNQILAKQQLDKPAKRKRETDSFTQKRNIIPNNINHILSYIQRKSKSEDTVDKIIGRFGGGEGRLTSKRFYCYMGYLKQKLHIHVNKETLRQLVNHLDLDESIFTVEEQLFFNKVSRTLICYYLKQLAKLTILSSRRVKLTSKLDHLVAHRTLLEYMMEKDGEC